jgi:hypothetical protein
MREVAADADRNDVATGAQRPGEALVRERLSALEQHDLLPRAVVDAGLDDDRGVGGIAPAGLGGAHRQRQQPLASDSMPCPRQLARGHRRHLPHPSRAEPTGGIGDQRGAQRLAHGKRRGPIGLRQKALLGHRAGCDPRRGLERERQDRHLQRLMLQRGEVQRAQQAGIPAAAVDRPGGRLDRRRGARSDRERSVRAARGHRDEMLVAVVQRAGDRLERGGQRPRAALRDQNRGVRGEPLAGDPKRASGAERAQHRAGRQLRVHPCDRGRRQASPEGTADLRAPGRGSREHQAGDDDQRLPLLP